MHEVNATGGEEGRRDNKYPSYIFISLWLGHLRTYALTHLSLPSLVNDFHLDSCIMTRPLTAAQHEYTHEYIMTFC